MSEFLKEFERRFSSFCNRAPVPLKFKTTPDQVLLESFIQLPGELEPTIHNKFFAYDFGLPVIKNIFLIREWLEQNWYPILCQEVCLERKLTSEELEELMDTEHISVKEAVLRTKKTVVKKSWIVTKINPRKDELFIVTHDSEEGLAFKLSVPSVVFLKRLREQRYTPTAGWDELCRHGTVLYSTRIGKDL